MVIRAKTGFILQVDGPAKTEKVNQTIVVHMGTAAYTVASFASNAEADQGMSDLWDAWAPDGSMDFTS